MSHRPLCVIAFAMLAMGSTSMAATTGPVGYRCSDGGSLFISKIPGGGIHKSRTIVKADGSPSSIQMATIVIDCSEARMRCLREGFDPQQGVEQAHVFAVPKRIEPSSRYRAGDAEFDVGPFRRSRSGRLRTTITVAPTETSGAYDLEVEDRRGIVAVRFHELIAPRSSRRENEWRFDDATCAVDDREKGLFPDVRLMP